MQLKTKHVKQDMLNQWESMGFPKLNIKHGLFHLPKCSDKVYGNIFYMMQIEMSNFIQVPASLVFAAISEF